MLEIISLALILYTPVVTFSSKKGQVDGAHQFGHTPTEIEKRSQNSS